LELKGRTTELKAGDRDPASFHICLISLYNSIASGMRVISALLKREGYAVDFVFLHGNLSTADHPDPFTSTERELLAGLCKELKPDLVGIGVASSFLHRLMREVVATIRATTDAPILLGGNHVTIVPERCVAPADYLCIGEGEATIVGLAECLRMGNLRALKDVPGLVYRGDGRTKWNPERCPVEDLDSLPYQDIDETGKYLLESNRLVEVDPILEQSCYPTYVSRGCPFSCSFCSRDLINDASGLTRALRFRSPEHVIGELEAARQKCLNIRSIRFWDDTFPTRLSWLREFTQLYKDRIGLPFGVWLHPKSAGREAMCTLREAGLVSVDMGIESGSQRIRREIFNRPEKQEDVIAASHVLTDYEIERVTFDLILEHEYEHLADKWETLDLLLGLKKPFKLNMHGLSYLPKTALTERAIKDGFITEEDLEFIFEGGLAANMLRHRWVKRPHLDNVDARGLVWPRLYFLTQYPFLSPRTIRGIARWANRNNLVARTVIRFVDMLWGMEEWRPELGHPGLVQRVRRGGVEPFLRAHPGLVFVGRLILACTRRVGSSLGQLVPRRSVLMGSNESVGVGR